MPQPAMARMSLIRSILLAVAAIVLAQATFAQLPDITSGQRPEPEDTLGESVPTMFPHPEEGRYWISGQMNFILQQNAPFYAEYSGAQSFKPVYESTSSRIMSLYTGFEVSQSIELLANVESASGLGLSHVHGVAGFPDLDSVKGTDLNATPYLARVMYHQVIALSPTKAANARNPLSTFSELPERRIEIRVGKFAVTDFFDINSVGSDSHLQFMNWSVDQGLHRGPARLYLGSLRRVSES